jgi:hypothetical protein
VPWGLAKVVVAVKSWPELVVGGGGVGVREEGFPGGSREPARGLRERPKGGWEVEEGGTSSVSVEAAEDEARRRRSARSSRFAGPSSMLLS